MQALTAAQAKQNTMDSLVSIYKTTPQGIKARARARRSKGSGGNERKCVFARFKKR